MFLIAGGAAVVAAIVAAVVVFGFSSGTPAEETIRAAGFTVTTYPAKGRQHVEKLPKGFKYNSFPPTTGPHNPVPAPWDVYEEPVDQMRLVHNEEHGGMIIQYGDKVPQSTVDEIVEWYRKDPNGIVIAPLPKLGDQIALGAWVTPDPRPGQAPPPGQGVLAKGKVFDEGAFDAFKDKYAFRGPERFPRSSLQPGT